MKISIFFGLFLCCHSQETEFAKIICKLEVDKNSDILCAEECQNVNILVKNLAKQCDIRARILPTLKMDSFTFVAFQKVEEKSWENHIVNSGIVFFQDFLNVSSRIDQDIKFIDSEKFTVFESYKINGKVIKNVLGQFNSSTLEYFPKTRESIQNRRKDFQGLHFVAVTEVERPFMKLNVEKSPFDAKTQTYDVTHSASGMFYEVLQEMQRNLNFTTTLRKRKDSIWGVVTKHENGTISATGMIQSLMEGHAEMAVASMAQSTSRLMVADLLPPILPAFGELYIKNSDDFEISWKLFLNPISKSMWMTIVIIAIVHAISFTFIHRMSIDGRKHSKQYWISIIMGNFWTALTSNIGGKPSKQDFIALSSGRILLFSCLLFGSVIWMAYRASITSELSVVEINLPFEDLETLYESNYRLIVPPEGYFVTEQFSQSKEGSIYQKIYKKNIDGKSSSMVEDEALATLMERPKTAYFNTREPVLAFTEYHCKMTALWESPYPIYNYAMYMKKHSPYIPFITHEIVQMFDNGVINRLYKNFKNEPKCLESHDIISLGMEKTAALFVIFTFSCFLAVSILAIEKFFKKSEKKHEIKKVNSRILDKVDEVIEDIQNVDFVSKDLERKLGQLFQAYKSMSENVK